MLFYNHEIKLTYPPYAFGDGNHETTRLLLYFLNRYVKGKSYIDCGCGTGILSIFASMNGASSVIAIDIDDNAVSCVRNNVCENNIDNIAIIKADVEKTDFTSQIVTANFSKEDAPLYIEKLKQMASELLITTWHKSLPTEPLFDMKIIEYIEGVDYDIYVLKKEKK